MDNYQKKHKLAGTADLADTVCLWYSDVTPRMPAIVMLLSQQGFPKATRVVLNWLAKYFEHCQDYSSGTFPNMYQVVFLIDSFVFFKTDQVQIQLTLIRELHLLEEICLHFQSPVSPLSKHMTFEALFGGRISSNDTVEAHRKKVLFKTVSMALSLEWNEVLECSAVWLDSQNLSTNALGLADSILFDFCDLLPNAAVALQRLPLVCPQFLNQLLPCVFSYFCEKGYKDEEFPPSTLVFTEIAGEWLIKDPYLCLLHIDHPLKQSSTFLKYRTKDRSESSLGPVGHILQFCILYPLWKPCPTKKSSKDATVIVSKLFFATMQSVMSYMPIQPHETESMYLITSSDVTTITTEMKRRLKDMDPITSEVELCLDRLAETIQIGKTTNQIEMPLDELKLLCKELPYSKLLEIVLFSSNEQELIGQIEDASPI